MLSILHRITGIVLSVGILPLVYWLASAAGGEESYGRAFEILSTTPALLFLAGWSFCFFYHFFNGVRHLLWDVGYGFEIRQVNLTGWLVVIAALGCTAAFWTVALSQQGAGA